MSNVDPSKGCEGKKRYWSFKHADRDAQSISTHEREPFHAYHCRHCNRFHVGSHFREMKAKVS